MDVRSLSVDQLKGLRKQLLRSSRRFFFFTRMTATIEDVSLDCIKSELKRRKVQNLKLGERATY